jgi:TPP-dependent pyruvate/acetoin dehydrogenase alpha subunit
MDGHIEASDLLSLYETMCRIRRFEEAAGDLMAANRIPGFLHLSIGQEAVAAGVCSQLTPTDYITSTHRGHGHCIAKGGKVDRMMAELFGKPEGYCKGRSGSMHIADPGVGILGANAIVAAGLPIATGAALGAQIRGEDLVAVTFFGEGAVAEGVFHESLNLASLWKLPIVFVCENNQYAELSHVSKHLSAVSVSAFGGPYRIPSATYDGNDVVEVRQAAGEAVDRARAGNGPSLLEFHTYRWRGHFEGDQGTYRTDDEVARWRLRDPLVRVRERLVSEFEYSENDISSLEAEVQGEIDEAVLWANELAGPDTALLTEDVYASDFVRESVR